jgi:hypothetical protein
VKRLRVTVHVDPDRAPAFFALLANAPEISRARIVDWNLAPDRMGTLLFAIDGDPTRFAEEAPDTTGIESVHLSEPERGRASALVVMRPSETPVFAALQRASTRTSLVVRTPIVYRDGAMQARVVGDS